MSSIRKRGKNSWEVTVEQGYDKKTGKRKRITETIKGKKRDAEIRRAELEQLARGSNYNYKKPEETTLEAYLPKYLKGRKSQIGERTWERYEGIINKHLIPALGNIYLTNLTPHMIQDYYEYAIEEGRIDGKEGGLSSTTVKQHHAVLRKALQFAVDNKATTYNPALSVKPPKKNKPEIKVLTANELNILIQYFKSSNSVIYIPVFIAANTGARLSEVLALRWRDIDFNNKIISISRSLQQGKKGLFFGNVKTSNSERKIAISDEDIAVLKQHKKNQAQQKLLLGQNYNDQDLICAKPDGTPMKPFTVSSRFKRTTQTISFDITYHSLRHSHATLLLAARIPPRYVSARLGHSSTAFTQDTYVCFTPEDDRKTADTFQHILKHAESSE